jgi:type II secretory pathway pseudopilin PulG
VRSEAGYNLVVLMVALTLFNIALVIALPKWSHAIRREREEELISRGWQYAEAVRVFQNRFQRLPVRIQELAEVEPRSIRKLWKDPMTEEGDWVLIPVGGQAPPLTPKEGQEGEDENGRDSDEESGEELDPGTSIGEKKGTVQVGPFIGVHSRSGKESILVFFGQNRYDEWHFTVDRLMGGRGGPPQGPGGDPANRGGGLQLSTRWLGRPLPSFLTPPQPTPPADPRGAR